MLTLLTVSGGRIVLAADRSYILGRGSDCDIIAEDMACSRHHARLIVDKHGKVAIEDLKSRNGVYVNDEKISRRERLKIGSRVQIGATVYLLSLLTVPTKEHLSLLDSGTIKFDPKSGAVAGHGDLFPGATSRDAGSEFGGQLSSIALADILEMIVKAHRSGTLHLELEKGRGRIEIRDGDILSASYEDLEGFQALLMMARSPKGIFWLVDNAAPCPKGFRESSGKVIFELRRVLARATRPQWR